MTTPEPAFALLVLAALLAGLGASVRALRRVDGKRRATIIRAGAGLGVVAAAVAVAPALLGPNTLNSDTATVAILAAAAIVGFAGLLEVALGLWLFVLALPAGSALRAGDAATAAGDGSRAAAAYGKAVKPLATGRRYRAELDARLKLCEALIAAGDLNAAAVQLHETLSRARTLGEPETTWSTLLRAVVVDSDLDRLQMANRHLGEAATVARELLTDSHIASVFAELAWVVYLGGDRELAGTCLGWAGRAAGQIDPRSAFAATTTLMAAHLALAAGDLGRAESALAAAFQVAPGIADPDLDAGIQVGRVCLAYLQGWKDSARTTLLAAVPMLHKARWRSRMVLPLIALSLEARRQQRTEDMATIGRIAFELAAKGGTQAELASRCANPESDAGGSPRAAELRNLLATAVTA